MKRKIKVFCTLIVALLLLLPKTVLALPSTITATAQAGGSISPAGQILVDEGGNQVFTITPQAGYDVMDVTVDGISVGKVFSYTFTNVNSDHTIDVTFEHASYGIVAYGITATAQEGGSISPAGKVYVNEGEDKVFTITPQDGYDIQDVLVDGVSVLDQLVNNTYTFVDVIDGHTITASFEESAYGIIAYEITATAQEGGSISLAGKVYVNEGEDKVFTITPQDGYDIQDVLVDGVSVLNQLVNNTYTFVDVIGEHTITASFTKQAAKEELPNTGTENSLSGWHAFFMISGISIIYLNHKKRRFE